MPKFVVERYELHAQKVEIEAASMAHAVAAVLNGEGTDLDNSLEYIEAADSYGLSVDGSEDKYAELSRELHELGVDFEDDWVPTIRSVEEVE